MKKILTIALTLMLVFVLALPTFAASYNGVELPEIGPKEQLVILYIVPYDSYIAYIVPTGSMKINEYNFRTDAYQYEYNPDSDSWVLFASPDGTYEFVNYDYSTSTSTKLIYCGFDVSYNGQLKLSASDYTFTPDEPDMCDGTSCPATDANHDNICDDCGKLLTMSLRSTLLEFAQSKAESWIGTWPYYAIVSDGVNNDRYNVYMSNQPQVADTATGTIVTSPNGLNRFEVSTAADGSFVASGNYGATEWSGELIYSNHTIANFHQPPLAATIQGVTGEAMELEIPNLHRTMMIILLCGVGCLALLILSSLLVKVFGRFRQG